MSGKLLFRFVCIISLWWVPGLLPAQPGSAVHQVQALYENLQYEEAIHLGKQLLRNPAGLGASDLALINRYLGVSWFSIGEPDSARTYFLSLLSIEPEAVLDSLQFSPKIIRFFQDVKNEYRWLLPPKLNQNYVRYIFINDRRPEATWRSLLLPGWGQMYKFQKKRALLVGGLFLGSVVSTGISWYLEEKYHDDYLNSTTRPELNDHYSRYNTWYKIRRTSLVVVGAVWLLNVADALWWPYSQRENAVTLNGGMGFGFRIPLR
ncbi:MAG: hypothetical protein Kow0042_16180 [Calditrichia bacterium]